MMDTFLDVGMNEDIGQGNRKKYGATNGLHGTTTVDFFSVMVCHMTCKGTILIRLSVNARKSRVSSLKEGFTGEQMKETALRYKQVHSG